MSMINFYESIPKKYKSKQTTYANYKEVHISIPNRIALIGSSGSGKSNILINLIYKMNCFNKIYMFVKCPDEPLYNYFIQEIRAVEKKLKTEILVVSTELNDLPEVDEFDKEQNNICIFDDVISETSMKLKKIQDLWIRGRKQNITSVFLSQNYHSIPILVRRNTDVLIFKKIGTQRDLTTILSDFKLDKTMDELKEMYKQSDTSNICNFFMIDTSPGQDTKWMYRKNFTPFEDLQSSSSSKEKETD